MTQILWEGAQKYDGFYWSDRVSKASGYHGDMREPQQLAYRSGGVGLARRTVPWAAKAARGRAPQACPARALAPASRRAPQACPARGAGTPGPRGGLARAGGWRAWPARGAGARGGLARLARAGGWHAWPRAASSPLRPQAWSSWRHPGLWAQGRARARGQACQPPARARRASPPRGPGAPAPRRARRASPPRAPAPLAGQACRPPRGQAWGARLEAGASARARPWQPRGQSVVPARRPRAAGELLCSPHVAMITGSFPHPIRPVKSIIFLCAFPQNLGSFRAGSYFYEFRDF